MVIYAYTSIYMYIYIYIYVYESPLFYPTQKHPSPEGPTTKVCVSFNISFKGFIVYSYI